ncbi:4575_t:CDS:2 [Acaulospora morrowiae]|uniref:4575_t:CDS:1 n=1 Tax=Acaulospora morrowiae TaxID=94023 RepID=A0A9N9GY92_9GLOM|nr:4575_t:CDS:2 [Acaulospora morrowiae]
MSFLTRKIEERNKLLLIFIHGFKGDDKTFLDFPERLQRILTESRHEIDTESIIYPRYETKGELKASVGLFCNWLEKTVRVREEEIKRLDQRGVVWVCLCGHSMGGILAADTIIKYESQSAPKPNIIGLFAFDTPYYGLEKDLFPKLVVDRTYDLNQKFNNAYSTFAGVATTAGLMSSFTSTKSTSDTQSSGYGKLLGYGIGLVGAVAVAGTVVAQKEKIECWIRDHLQYVGVLWNQEELEKRVNDLIELSNFYFHCYYTTIPSNVFSSERTFIKPPPPEVKSYFTPVKCTASDEVDAHTTMFDPTREQYFTLGSVIYQRITEMLVMAEK